VRERGGTPFRQIFRSRNGAPANVVGHRWNANTEAFRQITSYSLGSPSISLFSGPNCPPPNAGFGIENLKKKIPGVKGATPCRAHPSKATRHARGYILPRCCDLGIGNRSPKSKFTTTPMELSTFHDDDFCESRLPMFCSACLELTAENFANSGTVTVFKSRLKTFLFSRAFSLPSSQ